MKLPKVSVKNMRSSRGNYVPNQFIISVNGVGIFFQSYETIIAVKTGGKIILDDNWDYSVTTGKYRNQFLGEKKAETEKKIKSGQYKVEDLNGGI